MGSSQSHHLIDSSIQHLRLKKRQGSTITLTLNEQVLVFPDASVAVQVTVVVTGEKKEPDAGVQTAVTPGQLSLTVGSGKFTNAPFRPGSLNIVISAGQVITGGSVSFTVMVNEHEADPPQGSVTVQVTVVVPTGKKEPDGGLQLAVKPAGQSSVTVGGG